MPLLTNESGLRFGVMTGHVIPDSLTATLIAKAAFAIRPDAAAELLPEELQPHLDGDVSWDDDPARGLRSATDLVPYKPGTDLLLAGHCHAPGGRPVPFTQVSFAVGAFKKTAIVFGDRYLRRNVVGAGLTEPEPFTKMPLDWSRAFGGTGFARNPIGKGRDDVTLRDGSRVRPAPNVEMIGNLMTGSGSHLDPTGFGPIDPAWPPRAGKVGTYKSQWLAERWPWLPEDFDWSFFNAAPPDQFLNKVYLRGDESLEFVNLDPEHAVLKTRLPGLAARCFLRARQGNDLLFREVIMRIDTLFADMDAGHVVLTWRGVTPASSLKLKEFEEYFVLLEPTAKPRGGNLADYEALYHQRRREIRSEFDVPPVILNPPALPKFKPPSITWADSLEKLADEIRARAKISFAAPPPAPGFTGNPLPAATLPPPPPPPKSLADVKAVMDRDWAVMGANDPRFPKKYPPPDFSDMEEDVAELEAFNGLPPEETAPEKPEWTRESVAAHVGNDGHLEGEDLSGLDLSGIAFDGVRFTGADLEGSDLSRCTLDRADLTRAALAEAKLDDAKLDGAVLDEADLSDVSARGASFIGASLADADFTGGKLPNSRFRGARGPRVIFTGCDLTEADFEGALLEGADFSEALLPKARFVEAVLTRADFDRAEAPGATFEKASAFNLRASKAALGGACFRHCAADESVMEESVLSEADFRGARLRLATLTGSNLTRAVFAVADLREAKLDDIVAPEASFVGVNLFRGTLERADLKDARFLDCNLYEVELYQAAISTTRFDETNLKGTKLEL